MAGKTTEFAFGNIQPAPVFRRVAEVDAADVLAGAVRLKGFVERADGVRVQVVANQRDPFAGRVAGVQQGRHFHGPIHLRAVRTGRGLAKTGERLGKHKDARRPGPFVFVIDTLRMLRRGGDRRLGFLQQLHGLLVHAQHRLGRIHGTNVVRE